MRRNHRTSIDANDFQKGQRVRVRDSQGDTLIVGTVVRANDKQVLVKYLDKYGRWQTTYYYPRYVEAE